RRDGTGPAPGRAGTATHEIRIRLGRTGPVTAGPPALGRGPVVAGGCGPAGQAGEGSAAEPGVPRDIVPVRGTGPGGPGPQAVAVAYVAVVLAVLFFLAGLGRALPG